MKMQKEDTILPLARRLIAVKYQDLPAEAVEATKKDILDTLATTLAGTSADGIKEVRDMALGWGGAKEGTLIGHGGRLPSPVTAFVNGTTAHARDWDDIHNSAVIHAGVTAIPATLAIAEVKGKVSGKDYILANALGIDLMCRLGIAPGIAPVSSGWHNTPVFGVLGSAFACGILLNFDLDKMVNAIGIAYSQAAGTLQCIQDGALVKRMHAGFGAKGAVLSALLAGAGYTGAKNILDGKYGLFNQYFKGYDRDGILADLGKKFEIVNMSFKPYPCCRGNHSSIDAALALAAEHSIDPKQIEKIVVFHGTNTLICLEPFEVKRNPSQVVDAQFSIPYTVARAFIQRKVSIRDFTPEAIKDPQVLALAGKVEKVFKEELTVQRAYEPVIMEVHMTGDRVYTKRIDLAKGDPENPMTWQDLAEKFRDGAAVSTKPMPRGSVDKAIDLITGLEEVSDISQVVRLIS